MFKAFGNFLHRTPWWAMILIGLLSLIMLGIFTLPAQVIRLSSSGETPEMNRAIKREIDSAFGDSALGLAEGVVAAMRERTTDPARRRELDQAQEGIAEARREIFNAQDEIKRAVKDAAQGAAVDAAQAARDAAKDSAATAIDGALTAAEAMLESASERREAIEEARADVEKSLKSAGVVAPDALKSLDEQLRAVKTQEEAAKKAVEALTKSKVEAGKANLDLNFDINGTKFKISGGEGAKEELKAAIKAGVEKGIKEATKGAPRVSNSAPKPPPAGSASPAPPAPLSPLSNLSPLATPVAPAAPAAPALPALPADLRQDIHAKVAQDVKRIGLGSALILTFIPLFFMTLIAKFLIDRSRRAQAFGESQKKVAEVQSAGRQLMEARLQALQAQVEPHFLYNTLANVQALTEVDPPAANKMVGHLIEYLRAALPKMRETSSTIGQEVELARAYLNILKMRMGARLDFEISVPDDLKGMPFPPLMLPSLVENAIKHGLEPVREGGRIDVIAEKIGNRIRVIVKDTGRGLSTNGTTSANAEKGGGVGLANIRERLLALYGETAKLSLESNAPKGVVAIIEIPADAMVRFSTTSAATGAAPTKKSGAANATTSAVPPKGWAGRTLSAVGTTHSVWARAMSFTFIGLMVLLAILFGLALAAMAAGWMPLTFGHTDLNLSGMEGMAIGSVVLLFVFGLLAVVALLVVAIIYGLGVLAAGLLVFIPLVILISVFPALSPFVLFGLIIYWWFFKRKKKDKSVAKQMTK
jgi:Histidine kinase